MTQDNYYIADLAFRNLFGELTGTDKLTDEEQNIVLQWLSLSRHNRAVMNRFRDPKQFGKLFIEFLSIDTDAAWERARDRIATLDGTGPSDTIIPPKPDDGSTKEVIKGKFWNFKRLLGGLAAAIIILLIWLHSFMDRKGTSRDAAKTVNAEPTTSIQLAGRPVLELWPTSRGYIGSSGCMDISKTGDEQIAIVPIAGCNDLQAPDTAIACTLRTARNQRYTAIFRDGSRITLNAGSTLKMPSLVNGRLREVTLEGEAYFDIVPSGKEASFTVHIDWHPTKWDAARGNRVLSLLCLGTRFTVKAYKGTDRLVTTLDQGKVRLEAGGQKLILEEGETAILDDSGVLKKEDSLTISSSWKDGEFVFSQQRADRDLEDIARWYGIKISYLDSPPSKLIYQYEGRQSEPLDSLFRRLANLGDFNYTLQRDTIFVSH